MFSPLEVDNNKSWTASELSLIKASQLVPSIVYHVFLMLFGSVGNFFVILVYSLKFKSSTHRNYIVALAIFDFLASSVGVALVIYELINVYTFTSEWGCKLYRVFQLYTAIAAGAVLVLISFERRRRICKPLQPQLSVKNAYKLLAVFAGFFSAVSASPDFVFAGVLTVDTGMESVKGHHCFISDKYFGTVYYFVFHLGYLWCVSSTMTMCLSINYFFVVRKIRSVMKMREKQKSLSPNMPSVSGTELENFTEESTQRETLSTVAEKSKPFPRRTRADRQSETNTTTLDRKSVGITKMLICVTVTFMVSSLPHMSILIARLVQSPDKLPHDNVYMFLFSSYLLNNTVNPFIYATMDSKFRKHLKDMIFCSKMKGST